MHFPGLRVLSIAYVPDRQHSAFACLVAAGGEVVDHLRLPHLLYRRNSYDALERTNKEADMTALRRYVLVDFVLVELKNTESKLPNKLKKINKFF